MASDLVPCATAWHPGHLRPTAGKKSLPLDFNALKLSRYLRMAAVRQRNMLVAFTGAPVLVGLRHGQQRGRPLVDVALKLNVLAVFAAFVFVSAILLGAF
jgi:hypothetical protein